jgi:hypothetical protein
LDEVVCEGIVVVDEQEHEAILVVLPASCHGSDRLLFPATNDGRPRNPNLR